MSDYAKIKKRLNPPIHISKEVAGNAKKHCESNLYWTVSELQLTWTDQMVQTIIFVCTVTIKSVCTLAYVFGKMAFSREHGAR